MKEGVGEQYVYIYLDTRKPGKWYYKDLEFDYQPFYVGRGKGRRIKCHLFPSSLKFNSIKNKTIKRIRIQTGSDPIYYKIYTDLSLAEADKIEIEIIAYFGRRDMKTGILSNSTDGGDSQDLFQMRKPRPRKDSQSNSKRVDQFDLKGNFIQKFDSVTLAAKSLAIQLKSDKSHGYFSGQISKCCGGKTKSSQGFIWKFDGTSAFIEEPSEPWGKEVFQYSVKGDFIQRFPNPNVATKSLGVKKASSIYKCLSNKAVTAYNFRWFSSFQGDKIPPMKIKVGCFDSSGNLIKVYRNQQAVKNELGLNPFASLNSSSRKSGGFRWRYIDD